MYASTPNPVYTNIYHNTLQKSIAVYTKLDRYSENEMELGKAEEIAARLRQKIADGTLQAGTRLASERDLSTEFGVSRMTTRHAIEILESEGLVARSDNLPYRLIESYYPSDLFGELLTTDIGDKPLFLWLQERYGLRVSRAQETLIARLATPRERQFLHISPSAPVVALDRTVWTETKRPVEWAHIVAIAALYTFTYEYDILEWNKEQKRKVK